MTERTLSYPGPDRRRAEILGLILLHWAMLAITWNGIDTSDAYRYASAAFGLNVGQLPDTHWGLRWPLVLPMAISVTLFGESEFALLLPTVVASTALVWVTWRLAEQWIDRDTGRIAAILMATSPLFAVPDIHVRQPELLLTLIAIACLARSDGRRLGPFVVAGFLAWLAWACRETSAYLPVMLGLGALILVRPWQRGAIGAAVLGATFAAAILLEWTFYRLVYGDWIYRIRVDMGHGGDTAGTAFMGNAPTAAQTWLMPLVESSLSPMTPIFLVALAGIAIAPFAKPDLTAPGRRAATYLGLGSIGAYALCVGALNLEWYRYYSIVPYAATLIAAWAIARMGRGSRQIIAGVVLVAICLGGPVIRGVRDQADSRAPYRLAQIATERDAVVKATDFVLHAQLLLRLAGEPQSRVVAIDDPAQLAPGDLVFLPAGGREGIESEASWTELDRYPPSPLPVLLRPFAGLPFIGPSLTDEPGQVLWRVGPPG